MLKKAHLHIAFFFVLSTGLIILFPSTMALSENGTTVNSGKNVNEPGIDYSTAFDSIRTDLHDYIWPTNASNRVTSSFAEFRSTHFHGGIDISTNGRTGYDVFAVRDGYIYRISISPNGYGKMLYVKHSDGYVSTYAHLKGFNSLINSIAREEQYRAGSFAIDVELPNDRIPVKKGEVIAYTGDTGFGPPHLHFEIRDENLNPVNPMLCKNYFLDDGISPKIRRMLIEPLDASSMIDNSHQSKIFSRFSGKQQSYRLPQKLRLHGKIGIGLEAQDRNDGTWSKAGIYRMELYVDDQEIYSMQLDRIPAIDSKMILLHYDLPMIRGGRGKFQKLYIDEGNYLPIYQKRKEGSGIINTEQLTEGEHDLRIVCMDIKGNKSELAGTFIVNHRPEIEISRIDDEEIVLAGDALQNISRCIVYGKKNNSGIWSERTFEQGKFEVDGNGIELPFDTRKFDVVKVVTESRSGARSAPAIHFMRKPSGPAQRVTVAKELVGNTVRLTVTSPGIFTGAPILLVHEGKNVLNVDLEAVDLSKYVGVYEPSDAVVGDREIVVEAEVNTKPVTASEALELYPLPSHRGGSFETDKGGLSIAYDSASVFSPLPMTIQLEQTRGSALVYSLEPQDVLLNRGITVSVPLQSYQNETNAALYYRSNGGWIFQTSIPDSTRMSFSTRIARTLGDFAIFRDNEKPTIGRLRVLPRNGKPYISFRYYDNLSGVDADEIKLYIDGGLVIPEIDSERRKVWFEADERLSRGKHSVLVVISDRMGNTLESTRNFTVR